MGLILVYLAIFLELDWVWGLLFLLWVLPDLKTGTTYFIEPLSIRSQPFLYLAVTLTWTFLSLYLLIAALV